jgi:predicted Zn-dependent protease
VWRELVAAGVEHSRDFLIDLLVEQGRADEAVTVLQVMPYSYKSISTADVSVARLLDEQGRPEDAIRILRATGSLPEKLAALLAAQGRVDEAVRALDRAIADTHTRYSAAVERLTTAQADLLIEHGRIEELRTRAATGHPAYGMRLAAHDRAG